MNLSRRGLFGVLAGAIAAPYVARAGVLMPVKSIIKADKIHLNENGWYQIERVLSNHIITCKVKPLNDAPLPRILINDPGIVQLQPGDYLVDTEITLRNQGQDLRGSAMARPPRQPPKKKARP